MVRRGSRQRAALRPDHPLSCGRVHLGDVLLDHAPGREARQIRSHRLADNFDPADRHQPLIPFVKRGHDLLFEHQDELEGLIADWAAERPAEEIDRVLNAAGVICGPVYTIADIFADEHFWARDMLLKHEDPEFGEYIGPGITPKFSETPGEVRWSAPWEEGSHNREVYGELLGLSDGDLTALEEEGVL